MKVIWRLPSLGGWRLSVVPSAATSATPRLSAESDPDPHDPVLTFSGRCFQIGTSDFLLVLSLLEVHHGDGVPLGKLVDGLDVGLAHPPQGAEEGILNFRCPRSKMHPCPTGGSLGT